MGPGRRHLYACVPIAMSTVIFFHNSGRPYLLLKMGLCWNIYSFCWSDNHSNATHVLLKAQARDVILNDATRVT